MTSPTPPPSSSLRELLARERSEPHYALPSPPRRTLSSRHASPPPRGGSDGAVGTVVSMLSGYAGRFSRDPEFRRALREKCAACLLAPAASAAAARESAVLADLELAVESVERLADAAPSPRDSKIRSLRNSIRLLGVVASLHAPPRPASTADAAEDLQGCTCGVPDSHLAACAQLYLAIVYRMERDSRLAARHLLQVFVEA